MTQKFLAFFLCLWWILIHINCKQLFFPSFLPTHFFFFFVFFCLSVTLDELCTLLSTWKLMSQFLSQKRMRKRRKGKERKREHLCIFKWFLNSIPAERFLRGYCMNLWVESIVHFILCWTGTFSKSVPVRSITGRRIW